MSKFLSLAQKFISNAWNYVKLKDTAFMLSKPLAVKVTFNQNTNTYFVTLFYPTLIITLQTDENDNIIDYYTTDLSNLIEVLNDIYGELYNLAR